MTKTQKLVGVFLAIVVFGLGLHAAVSFGAGGQSTGANTKVDLNSASEKDLESLPGVGAATAKKIIAGRPYSSADDLSKAGVSAAAIKKITPLVTFGGATSTPVQSAATKSAASAKPNSSSALAAKVDLNNASANELKELPGVGDATAKKIVAGRPYSSVSDLSKAGVSAATIGKITSLVTVGNAPAAAASSPPAASASKLTPSPAASAAPEAPAPATPAKTSSLVQGSPGNGMVWVNTDSGVYHKEGSRYYGKTKNGNYMTEADAVKAGYRAAKKNE